MANYEYLLALEEIKGIITLMKDEMIKKKTTGDSLKPCFGVDFRGFAWYKGGTVYEESLTMDGHSNTSL